MIGVTEMRIRAKQPPAHLANSWAVLGLPPGLAEPCIGYQETELFVPFGEGHSMSGNGPEMTHSSPGLSQRLHDALFPLARHPGHSQPHPLPLAASPSLEVVEARAAVAAVPPGDIRQAGTLASHWVAGLLTD